MDNIHIQSTRHILDQQVFERPEYSQPDRCLINFDQACQQFEYAPNALQI